MSDSIASALLDPNQYPDNPFDVPQPQLTQQEIDSHMNRRFKVQYVGGPRCGLKKIVKVFRPATESRIFFITKNLCHHYLLNGNTDDGFRYNYQGVKRYVCNGNRTYRIQESK